MLLNDASDTAAEIVGRSRIAVLVPCHNEEAAIGKVVADFRASLPDAAVEAATRAGAIVRREQHQGKGRVVRRMFTDVDADIYVLIDGDATYDAPSAPRMEQLVTERLNMACAVRIDREDAAYRLGHRAGNRLAQRAPAEERRRS